MKNYGSGLSLAVRIAMLDNCSMQIHANRIAYATARENLAHQSRRMNLVKLYKDQIPEAEASEVSVKLKQALRTVTFARCGLIRAIRHTEEVLGYQKRIFSSKRKQRMQMARSA
jgi:hypothetical protein